MPESTIDPAVVNAGAQLVSTGATIAAQSDLNRKTRKWNEKMYDQQKTDAYNQWVMQNEYNSPQSQMSRLKSAGLNPNLVYGNGSAVNTAESIKTPTPQAWNPKSSDYSGLGKGITDYYAVQMQKQNYDNLKAQNDVLMKEAAFKDAQTANVNTDTAVKSFALNLDSELRPYSADYRRKLVDKLTADINNTDARTVNENARNIGINAESAWLEQSLPGRLKGLNLENASKEQQQRIKAFDESLQSSGMTRNDPMYIRMLKMFYDKIMH